MSAIFETTLRVRYAETDQMAVVYYANYINWFEVGRTEMLRQTGIDVSGDGSGWDGASGGRGEVPVQASGAL